MIGTEQPNPAGAAAEANTESRGLVETRAHRRAVRNTSPADDIGDVDVCRLGWLRDCEKMQAERERETCSDVASRHVTFQFVSRGVNFKGPVSSSKMKTLVPVNWRPFKGRRCRNLRPFLAYAALDLRECELDHVVFGSQAAWTGCAFHSSRKSIRAHSSRLQHRSCQRKQS